MLMRDEHEVTVSHMLMRDEHKVTELASMPLEPDTDALFYDAFDAFEVDNDLLTAVHGLSAVELAIAEVERLCSSESQQWESDCSGADLSVLQSFSEMLMPELDAHPRQVDTLGRHEETLPGSELLCQDLQDGGQDCLELRSESELTHPDRLAESARVASSFGVLMYEMLISRPDIAAAVGAFAAGLIGRSVTDHGIQHRGVQVLDKYLRECMSSCRQFAELGASSAWLSQRIGLPLEPHARESLTFY